jgi:hypothetical protein
MAGRHPIPWMLATLVGCQPPLVEGPTSIVDPPSTSVTAGGTDGDDEGDEPIRLDTVTPDFGTAGLQVAIEGGSFPSDAMVWFDDVEARVLERAADRLTVEVPALGPDGWREITVGASPDALPFRYFEDGSGRIGATGAVEIVTHPGPGWSPDQQDFRRARVLFTQPTDLGWEHLYAPAVDTCALEHDLDGLIGQSTGLPSISLTDGIDDLVLPVVDPATAFDFSTQPAALAPGAAFDLLPMVGDPDWPPFEVVELTGAIPEAFSVTAPAIETTAMPVVPPSFPLAWEGPYDGDLVLVSIVRLVYDGDSSWQTFETMSCWARDDGAFVVPDLWTGWSSTDLLLLEVGRANRPDAVLPHNNARSEVLGVLWVAGFLDAQ